MNTTAPTQSPKLNQYLEELNTLNAKYQYSLVAKLKVTESEIVPYISTIDVVPPKTEPKFAKKKGKK